MLEFFLEAFHSNKIASNVYVRVSTAGIQRACVIVSARISVSAEDKPRLGTLASKARDLFHFVAAKKVPPPSSWAQASNHQMAEFLKHLTKRHVDKEEQAAHVQGMDK